MSAGSSSITFVFVFVRKLVVICSGNMEPSFDLTIALEIVDDEFSFLDGEDTGSSLSVSLKSITKLLDSECPDAEGFSKVADNVRSG